MILGQADHYLGRTRSDNKPKAKNVLLYLFFLIPPPCGRCDLACWLWMYLSWLHGAALASSHTDWKDDNTRRLVCGTALSKDVDMNIRYAK